MKNTCCHPNSAITGTDANTAARRAWLASLQGKRPLRIREHLKTALVLVLILAVYGLVGHLDHEDELLRRAELDAYTNALATCQNERFLITANTQGE